MTPALKAQDCHRVKTIELDWKLRGSYILPQRKPSCRNVPFVPLGASTLLSGWGFREKKGGMIAGYSFRFCFGARSVVSNSLGAVTPILLADLICSRSDQRR